MERENLSIALFYCPVCKSALSDAISITSSINNAVFVLLIPVLIIILCLIRLLVKYKDTINSNSVEKRKDA